MSTKSALIIGATTGAAGSQLLHELLASPHYTRVGEFGPHLTPAASLPESAREKLVQRTIDLGRLSDTDDQGLRDGHWDVVFITALSLGPTPAIDTDRLDKPDRDYVLAAARAARILDAEHTQRLVFLSTAGPRLGSPRRRGLLTEQGLAALRYDDTIIARPGALQREDHPSNTRARPADRVGSWFLAPIMKAATLLAPAFSSRAQISVDALAKALATLGHLGSSSLPASAQIRIADPTRRRHHHYHHHHHHHHHHHPATFSVVPNSSLQLVALSKS